MTADASERMTPEQFEQYVRNGVAITSVIRSNARQGEMLNVQLEVRPDRMVGTTPIRYETFLESFAVNDVVVRTDGQGGMMFLAGGGSTGRSRFTVPLSIDGVALPVGDALLTGTYRVEATIGARIVRVPFVESRTIEVLGPDASLVRGIEDPAAGEIIREGVSNIRVLASNGYVNCTFEFGERPHNLAFAIFALDGDSEYRIGSMTVDAGDDQHSHGAGGQVPAAFKATVVDLIFRSEESLAARDPEVDSYWIGEIRFDDVPVIWPGEPPAP